MNTHKLACIYYNKTWGLTCLHNSCCSKSECNAPTNIMERCKYYHVLRTTSIKVNTIKNEKNMD